MLIVQEKHSGVETNDDGRLKRHKRYSCRRELIRAFVNNQSRTNVLFKQKRKLIEAKVALSLPEGNCSKGMQTRKSGRHNGSDEEKLMKPNMNSMCLNGVQMRQVMNELMKIW
ncbi:hypothetical protein M513_14209 [Trichuris suis]|uniref:Uncharacterized protein n=1 Tax=Trichuris suis TaxID=68888 RepID=A0A085LIW7_9BILA|nr:hypothetical protein M513_14209 [Trichuris suis]